MTPDDSRASYRRVLLAHGQDVTLQRVTPNGTFTYDVRARVMGYSPQTTAGSAQQGGRKAIVLAEDVESSGFPLPFREGQDTLVANGKTMTIAAVNDATRRVAGVLIAYEFELEGP